MRSSQDLSYRHQRRAGKGFSIESIRILTLLSINPSSMGSFSMHCSICSCLFTKLGSSTGKVKGRATFYSLSQLCHFSATLQLCQYSTGEQVHNYSCHPKNAMGYSCDSLFIELGMEICTLQAKNALVLLFSCSTGNVSKRVYLNKLRMQTIQYFLSSDIALKYSSETNKKKIYIYIYPEILLLF